MKQLLSCLLLFFGLCAGIAQAGDAVVFVLAATDKVLVSNPEGQQYRALPTQRLLHGHTVNVPKGQRFVVAVLGTGNRRVFNGPARLKVIADTVRVLKGATPKVFALSPAELDLIDHWRSVYARPTGVVSKDKAREADRSLQALSPVEGSLLLTRNPEFLFTGDLPREGNLILFDSRGKRFWVEPLESEYLTLPPAARFEWGQSFTWEVRRLTGGRVASGSFHIASEETARALLQARVPDTQNTLPESKLFYGMRLQLASAYKEAAEVWESLDIQLTPQGQPAPLQF